MTRADCRATSRCSRRRPCSTSRKPTSSLRRVGRDARVGGTQGRRGEGQRRRAGVGQPNSTSSSRSTRRYSYNHSEVTAETQRRGRYRRALAEHAEAQAVAVCGLHDRARHARRAWAAAAGVRYNSSSAGNASVGNISGSRLRDRPSSPAERPCSTRSLHYDQPRFRVALNASNLFDKDYVARCTGLYGCVYGAGRQVIPTLTGSSRTSRWRGGAMSRPGFALAD